MAVIWSIVCIPKTFSELAMQVLNVLLNYGLNSTRIDFVGDRYPVVSIKNAERRKRAKGGSLSIASIKGCQTCPRQWQRVLSDSYNKEKLISFLVNEWASQKYLGKLSEKELFVTSRDKCYKIYVRNSEILSEIVLALECTQEEADTRLLLHANHAAVSEDEKVVIKSSDSDVEVISIALWHKIATRIYILSATKHCMRLIDISEINIKFTQDVCNALLGLHAFTGCESVSAFLGKGKKKALQIVQNAYKYVNHAKFGNVMEC